MDLNQVSNKLSSEKHNKRIKKNDGKSKSESQLNVKSISNSENNSVISDVFRDDDDFDNKIQRFNRKKEVIPIFQQQYTLFYSIKS